MVLEVYLLLELFIAVQIRMSIRGLNSLIINEIHKHQSHGFLLMNIEIHKHQSLGSSLENIEVHP